MKETEIHPAETTRPITRPWLQGDAGSLHEHAGDRPSGTVARTGRPSPPEGKR